MNVLFWIAAIFLMFFRRRLIMPITGPTFYWLFEAILWMGWAAFYFANQGPWPIVDTIIGLISLVIAIGSVAIFSKMLEKPKEKND